MVVQQHVLNWLYSVLTSEYHDVNRTYNDVAQALWQYPSLSPRTDVHTFPNGVSALLLHLSGTIPVLFRGTTYRFPISLWVPHAYPREPPLVYVTPTDNMVVRPGQHVDPQGQVYHPYLVGWAGFWDKSTILDFLAILRDVFAKEPPVVAKQPTRPTPPVEQQAATPPPVPPLPPDMARPASTSLSQTHSPAADQARPPPPPPKGNDPPVHRPSPVPAAQASTAPPLPPHPPQRPDRPVSELPTGSPVPGVGTFQTTPQSNRVSRYDSAPPLPPHFSAGPSQYQSPGHPQPARPQYQQQLSGQYSQPPPDPRRLSFSPPHQHAQPPPPPPPSWQQQQQQRSPPGHPQHQQQQQQPPLHQQHPQHHQLQQQPLSQPPPQTFEALPHPIPQTTSNTQPQFQPQPPQQQQQYQPPPQQPTPKKPPPPDLMDEPLVLSVPSPSNFPAPPIPPNPEKDALLHQLAQTLHAMRQHSRAQDESTMAGLQAQRTAMLNALSVMQAEASGLSQLSALLGSNAGILRDALRRADGVIADARARQQVGNSSSAGGGLTTTPSTSAGTTTPGTGVSASASARSSGANAPPGLPDVDELLVAPTVVANQLYDLVAEERALADAVFVLGRAVERGRISPAVFAKTTRSLSREWFLKKALVRKIGRGMGLSTQ